MGNRHAVADRGRAERFARQQHAVQKIGIHIRRQRHAGHQMPQHGTLVRARQAVNDAAGLQRRAQRRHGLFAGFGRARHRKSVRRRPLDQFIPVQERATAHAPGREIPLLDVFVQRALGKIQHPGGVSDGQGHALRRLRLFGKNRLRYLLPFRALSSRMNSGNAHMILAIFRKTAMVPG